MKHIVIIPAAGIGRRFSNDKPKQYQALLGKTVLEHSIDSFTVRDDVAVVLVAVARNDPFIGSLDLSAKVRVVNGGEERSDSVYQALNSLQDMDEHTLIAVHDAARPCIRQIDIDAVFAKAQQNTSGALLVLESYNTLKQWSGGALKTLDRRDIYSALTPQVFSYGLLKRALDKVSAESLMITDEASAIESLAISPEIVIGSSDNIKITEADDLALAAFYLNQRAKHSLK